MRPRTPPPSPGHARGRSPAILGALSLAVALFAYLMGDSYIDRLPNHAGYFLLPVEDTVGVPLARPRHAVVILVDGLSKSTAEGFASKRRIAERYAAELASVPGITPMRGPVICATTASRLPA